MDSFKRLYQGSPGTSPASLYNVPDNFAAIVKDMEVINRGAASDTITLWVLPPGITSVSDPYIILPPTELDPGESLKWSGSRSLEADCSIYGDVATGSLLNVIITGMEVDETAAP